MTVFAVSTYVVKPEQLAQHTKWGKNLVASMKNSPDSFKEVQSLRVCRKKGEKGRFMALWEFKTAADRKTWEKRFRKEQLAVNSDFMALIVPSSFERHVWKPVKFMHKVSKHSLQT